MSNSVSKIELNNIDSFGNPKVIKNPTVYWLSTNKAQDGDFFSLNNNYSKIFITPDEARKTNNTALIGLSIAGATLVTAAGIFFLLKGGPKGLVKNFEKLRNKIERKVLESNLNTGAAPNKFLLYLLKYTKKASSHVEAVNNFTSFKDMLFTKIMNVTKPTGNVHKSITKLFSKIGRKAVESSYESALGRFDEANAFSLSIIKKLMASNNIYEEIEIAGKKMTRAEWLLQVRNLSAGVEASYKQNFGQQAIQRRSKDMQDAVDNLYEKFKDLRVFLSKDTLTKFMAEAEIAEKKSIIQQGVYSYRKNISYTLKDMFQDSDILILDIVKLLGHKDKHNIAFMAQIRANLRKYINSSASDNVLKTQILEDISSVKVNVETMLQNGGISSEKSKMLIKHLNSLSEGIDNFEQGKIQDIMQIYKALLSEDDYEALVKLYSSGVNSLDKSIKVETEDFFSKLRDLTLGSAPTDILTILGSIGVLGYQLGKSKDNDQRQSIALKYGFPALAGIGVSLYCNAKLFAGSKSLLVGATSTWLLNRIGEWGDKKLKYYKHSKAEIEQKNNIA